MTRILSRFVFCFVLAGCAAQSGEGSDVEQGALADAPPADLVRFGAYEYRYPGREGLVKRLVLREARAAGGEQVGTFERTEWHKRDNRLVADKVTGTFSTSTQQMPSFTRRLLHFKDADGHIATYRYKNNDEGELLLQVDRDDAPRTKMLLFEAADGTKAVYADCKATAVHDMTIFEEGLSVEEYPMVDFYRAPDNGFTSVSIGSAGFSSGDSDRVVVAANGDAIEGRVDRDGLGYLVRVRGATGEVRASENGRDVLVATLTCKTR